MTPEAMRKVGCRVHALPTVGHTYASICFHGKADEAKPKSLFYTAYAFAQ
jgi:hypothetical protein